MWFLIVTGSLFCFLAIGNLATGYVEWGTGFALLSIGAFILAFLTYDKGKHQAVRPNSALSRPSPMDSGRQTDIESRTLAALNRLAVIMGDDNDSRESIRRLERELERNDQDAEVWHALSQFYGEQGDQKRAFDSALTAIRLSPEEGRYHFTVSALLMMACAEAVTPDPGGFGVTPQALGMGYDEAREKAEFHARETIRLGALPQFEVQARENLFTLHLMREMKPAQEEQA